MKIERVNESQVRFVLSPDDLAERNIRKSRLEADSEETVRLFRELKTLAEYQIPACGARVRIDCVSAVNPPDHIVVQVTATTRPLSPVSLFAFSDVDDAARAAGRISANFLGESSLYKYDDGYWLLLVNADDRAKAAAAEYGNPHPASALAQAYLAEHGETLLPDDAVRKLSQYIAIK